MARFLSQTELYDVIQKMSGEAKEILWVCSPYLGFDAHKIFSQEIIKNPPSDTRFVFRVNDNSIKKGEVNPYELQYFMEHFNNVNVKSHDSFHSKIYIFDNSALITSANLTKTAFETNIEVGVILDGPQVDNVKRFFDESLWKDAKSIKEIEKYKRIWNISDKKSATTYLKKTKPHTKIKDWTDDYVNTWYFSIPEQISRTTERKIQKEANWTKNLGIVSDIGLNSFKQLKLGDLAFLADLSKKRGKIEIEFARIFDKSKVETDEGDLHFAYQTDRKYFIERAKFYEILNETGIKSKSDELILSKHQIELMSQSLSRIKRKRKAKS